MSIVDQAAAPTEPSFEMLSNIAEERRRNVQDNLARRAQSDFLLSVDQSEVMYTIEPSMLPFSQLDLTGFVERLSEVYRISFKTPQLPTFPQGLQQSDGSGAWSPRDLQAYVNSRNAAGVLRFEDGRFPLSRDDFVPIQAISLSRESIHAVVKGESQVADLIVAEVAELFWASTGVPKKWETIKQRVQLVSYATATRVNLGVSLESFLHPTLQAFLKDACSKPDGYGHHMTARSRRNNFMPSESQVVTYTVDDLNLLFHVFDTTNGRAEELKFRFSVQTRDEHGTGIFLVISELPFDKHIESLAELKANFEKSKKSSAE